MKHIQRFRLEMNITRKVTLALVAMALILVTSVGVMAYISGRNSLTSAVVEELTSVATEKQAGLSWWVEEKQVHITDIARLRANLELIRLMRSADEGSIPHQQAQQTLRQNLSAFTGIEGEFVQLLLLDPDTGKVILSTDPGEEGKYKEIFPYFLEGRERPFVQSPYFSPELMGLAMAASAPIHNTDGELLAVLAGRLLIDEMTEIVVLSNEHRLSLDAFLVNTANLFLTQPRFISNEAVLRRGIHTEQVRRCLRHENGSLLGEDYRGESVIAVYRWLPDLESCLIVKMDHAEAVAPERRFGVSIALFGLFALIGAIFLAVWLAGTITNPLHDLEQAAIRFGQGELDLRLPDTGNDEVGRLARTFNAMAAALSADRMALQRRIEQIYTLAPSLIATASFDGYFIDLNPSWQKILGHSEESLKATPFIEFVHPEDREATIAEASRLSVGGTTVNFENRYRTADGGYRWLSWVAVGIEHDQMLYAVAQDITEQREAEENLRASEAEMRAILASMNDVILVLNADAHYVKVAATGTNLLVEPTEKLIGNRMHDVFGEETGDKFVGAIRRTLDTGEPVNIDYQLDYPDGRTIWFSATLNRMNSDLVVWVARDVTARKQSEQTLAQQAEELARSNRELEQFAYVASHDLQEPLRTVTSAVQLLSRRYQGKLDSDADEFIGFATDAAERMKQLINDLLLYSRAGTRGKPFKPVSMEDVLNQTVGNLRFLMEDENAQVTWDEVPAIDGDEGQLVQLFQNLISNGIKFHGEDPPVIRISAEPYTGELDERSEHRKYWHFRIQDNGLGIENTYLDRIFIIFQRLNSSVDYPGTGIGLALCKKIVERHHGRIWVDSSPGEGSTFHLTLPAPSSSGSDFGPKNGGLVATREESTGGETGEVQASDADASASQKPETETLPHSRDEIDYYPSRQQ